MTQYSGINQFIIVSLYFQLGRAASLAHMTATKYGLEENMETVIREIIEEFENLQF